MQSRSHVLAGMAIFIAVMLGNALTIILVRYLSESELSYSPFQLVFLANGIGGLLALLIPRQASAAQKAEPNAVPLPLAMFSVRAILEFLAFSASFYAISQMPLSMHTSLLFMAPIFGTVIAILVLKEHGSWATYGTIAIGFIGMLIITQPTANAISDGVIFALLSAFGFACCGTMIKLLSRTQPSYRIARFMMLPTALIAAPFAAANWQPIAPDHWPAIAALGGLACFLQHGVAMAMARAPLISIIPLNFMQLVFVSVLAWLAFGETVGQATIIGASIILSATLFNAWHGSRHAREMTADSDA